MIAGINRMVSRKKMIVVVVVVVVVGFIGGVLVDIIFCFVKFAYQQPYAGYC